MSSKFRLANIASSDQDIQFYTGFPNYASLNACFEYLGPAVDHLNYWRGGEVRNIAEVKRWKRNRALKPMEEFFSSTCSSEAWPF